MIQQTVNRGDEELKGVGMHTRSFCLVKLTGNR